MASFTTTELVGDIVLVEGTDINGVHGSTKLDSTEWKAVQKLVSVIQAEAEFDVKVNQFFMPLTDAANWLEAVQDAPTSKLDPAQIVELRPEIPAQEGQEGVRAVLSHHSTILRLLSEGDVSRLIWVDGELEMLAEAPAPKKQKGRK